jgi:hypothetical protein
MVRPSHDRMSLVEATLVVAPCLIPGSLPQKPCSSRAGPPGFVRLGSPTLPFSSSPQTWGPSPRSGVNRRFPNRRHQVAGISQHICDNTLCLVFLIAENRYPEPVHLEGGLVKRSW